MSDDSSRYDVTYCTIMRNATLQNYIINDQTSYL